MFSKIAAKNVRRSLRDYLVYFVTLMLAVCIFYMFNSVDAQMEMLNLRSASGSGEGTVVIMMRLLSVVISFVLAFLIVYANGFIMRRRKREFGVYMVLGVSSRKISGMLAVETLIIGVLALAAGLVCGYFASQGMSILTASLFEVTITEYHFIFSVGALISTCVYFAVIFLLVMLFNIIVIRRYTLARLLHADRTNQMMKERSPMAQTLKLLAGVALIGLSYWLVIEHGIVIFETLEFTFLPLIAVNFAGTLVFLYGLAGLTLASRKHSNRYYVGLNMFSQRQLASRINTNAVSMAFICTILFLTLVIVSSVSSVNSAINESADAVPFDVSFTTYSEDGSLNVPVEEAVQEVGIAPEIFSQTFTFPVHETDVAFGTFSDFMNAGGSPDWAERMRRQTAMAVSVSDFNQAMAMQGKGLMSLAEGQFGLLAGSQMTDEVLAEYLVNPVPITLAGQTLAFSGALGDGHLWTSQNPPQLVLVVPDAVAAALPPAALRVMVADYAVDTAVGDQLVGEKVNDVANYQLDHPVAMRMALASDIRYSNGAINASMTFVGLYLGMVFMVAGAALLALQMLSSATDDRPRYALLADLGTPARMADRSVLRQVAIYFFLPFALACAHASVGIWFMEGILNAVSATTPWGALLMALVICAIYLVYFAATYLSCRRIIRTKDTRRQEQ